MNKNYGHFVIQDNKPCIVVSEFSAATEAMLQHHLEKDPQIDPALVNQLKPAFIGHQCQHGVWRVPCQEGMKEVSGYMLGLDFLGPLGQKFAIDQARKTATITFEEGNNFLRITPEGEFLGWALESNKIEPMMAGKTGD